MACLRGRQVSSATQLQHMSAWHAVASDFGNNFSARFLPPRSLLSSSPTSLYFYTHSHKQIRDKQENRCHGSCHVRYAQQRVSKQGNDKNTAMSQRHTAQRTQDTSRKNLSVNKLRDEGAHAQTTRKATPDRRAQQESPSNAEVTRSSAYTNTNTITSQVYCKLTEKCSWEMVEEVGNWKRDSIKV